jgi:hypothetical protein
MGGGRGGQLEQLEWGGRWALWMLRMVAGWSARRSNVATRPTARAGPGRDVENSGRAGASRGGVRASVWSSGGGNLGG